MRIVNAGRGIHQREIPGIERLHSLPNEWIAFTNLDLSLPQGSREIDVILIADDRIMVIDLKDWHGKIESDNGSWIQNGYDKGRSPVGKINENAKQLWTHGNAIWGARVSALHQRLARDDVYLVFLPYFHANAQTYCVLPTLWAGGKVVLQPKFSARRFWPVSLEQRVTRTSMVPFCLRALFEQAAPTAHHYRTWGLGVAHPRAEAKFRVTVLGWWGMTETVSQAIVSDAGASHPFMSMGYVSPAYEIEVRNDQGHPVLDQIGQLYIRGERGVSLFQEYVADAAATSDAFDADGWFKTGDQARLGPEGDVFFEGRLTDIIKCGGENISAAEIEAVIARVQGVRESAVISQPDPNYGEVPVAFVIAQESVNMLEERILDHCRRELAPFKVPRRITVVAELPRGALNKVAKNQLRNGLL